MGHHTDGTPTHTTLMGHPLRPSWDIHSRHRPLTPSGITLTALTGHPLITDGTPTYARIETADTHSRLHTRTPPPATEVN